MFRISTKVKLASAIVAGALALGAAGAYAAGTITVPKGATIIPITGKTGTTGLSLVALNGQTLTLKPFTSVGQCADQFATNRNYALAPTSGTLPKTIGKNYHGKLMSAVAAWCRTQVTPKDSPTAEPEASDSPDATESEAPETEKDSGGSNLGPGHGHGGDSATDD